MNKHTVILFVLFLLGNLLVACGTPAAPPRIRNSPRSLNACATNCNLNASAGGHYLVSDDQSVFMAPALILHYIVDHQSCPPQEFVEVTISGKFLTEDDLEIRWRS